MLCVSVCSPLGDGHLRCHPPLSPPNPLRPVPHLAVSSLLAISDTKLLLTEARRAIGCRDRTAPRPAAASTTRNRLLLRFPSPRLRDTPPGGPTHTAVHNKNLPASRPVPSLERLALSCPDRHLQGDGAAPAIRFPVRRIAFLRSPSCGPFTIGVVLVSPPFKKKRAATEPCAPPDESSMSRDGKRQTPKRPTWSRFHPRSRPKPICIRYHLE